MSAALPSRSLSPSLKSTFRSLTRAHTSPRTTTGALPRLSALSRTFASTRSMSASVPTKEWLVHIPDHPNALDKRLAIRPKHLDDIKPKIEAGIVLFGGATLSKHPSEGEGPDMTGSFMLIKANTEAEVKELLENDAYTKAGAWNPKEAKIWPFKTAVRTAL